MKSEKIRLYVIEITLVIFFLLAMIFNETITRTPADKIAILKEMQENIKSIYTMIFKDLECLFYQLV